VSPLPGGAPAGGTSVTITGTGLGGATRVSFGRSAVTFTAASGTRITAISPPGNGTVDVIVTTPAGASAATAADQFTYGLPAVIEVFPASGPTEGGTRVTIIGTGLGGATSVIFGGTEATFTAASDTQITAISPPGNGTVDIIVITPAGASAATVADQFDYYGPIE
jgi:hypothetical protein